MKKSITIRIPEPCHEDWATMTPTQKGRHCQVCTKEVFDFTKLSDEQIIKKFQQNSNLCGRFKTTQVDREMKLERKRRNSFLPIAASFMLPLSILATQDALGQKMTPNIQGRIAHVENTSENTTQSTGISEEKNDQIIIKGTIIDNENLPLPGVNIIIKGTTVGTQTDIDGNYTITAKAGQTLVFSYIGFLTEEAFVSNIKQRIDLAMRYDDVIMGDLMILGMVAVDTNPKTNEAAKPYANMEKNHGDDSNLTQDEKQALKNAKEFERLKRIREKAERLEKKAKRKTNKQ